MLTLRTTGDHLGHFGRPWQFDELGTTPDDPMNRQERESIEQRVKVQVLAALAKDRDPSEPPVSTKNWLLTGLTWLRKWASVLALIPIIGGVVYWQFFFDLRTTVDKLVTDNATVATLNTKINGSAGEPGISDRLAKMEGSLDQLSKDFHTVFEGELRHVSELPQADFDAEIPKIPAMVRLASTDGYSLDPSIATALGRKMLATAFNTATHWNVAGVLIDAASRDAATIQGAAEIGGNNAYSTFEGGIFKLDAGSTFDHVLFKNAIIRYDGGPISLKEVTFQNCRFEFRIIVVPPLSGQKLTKTLLASTITDVKVD
jgi:hypothetical protein